MSNLIAHLPSIVAKPRPNPSSSVCFKGLFAPFGPPLVPKGNRSAVLILNRPGFEEAQLLRGLSHEQVERVLTRGPRTCCSHGAGTPRRIPAAVGGCEVDRTEDRLRAADAADVGQTPGGRYRCAKRCDHGRRATPQGTRTREQGAAPGQRDPEVGQRVFGPDGTRPPTQVLRDFIDKHRDTHGVRPICKVLQIAPSGYRRYACLRRNPEQRCVRARRDEAVAPTIERVWRASMQVHGADKVWRQLGREGCSVARALLKG